MDVNPKQRRRHTQEFKAQVLAACSERSASVAAVARSFGLNDNLGINGAADAVQTSTGQPI